jgi:hypothetical protein
MGQDREDGKDEHSGLTAENSAYRAAIRNAVRYERRLAVKALIPFTCVALVILAYLYFQ